MNIFETLRAILDENEGKFSALKGADVIFAVGDLGEELGDALAAYSEAVQADVDGGGDGSDVVVEEPAYVPNIAVLTQAAVLALGIRGDIVDQLHQGGYQAESDEVAAFLGAGAGTEKKN